MHEGAGEHQVPLIRQPMTQPTILLLHASLLCDSYLAAPEEMCWQHASGSNIQDICLVGKPRTIHVACTAPLAVLQNTHKAHKVMVLLLQPQLKYGQRHSIYYEVLDLTYEEC